MASAQQTTVPRGPDDIRIGLCLSGGGFRAALYGLGVVRYLAEADLLRRVVAISAVSGGAVAAALLADRWPALQAAGYSLDAYQRGIELPFRQTLAEHNIRNAAIGRWAARRATLRGRSRGSAMGDALVAHLLRARLVRDLDPALQVILTSTDLTTGRAFRVSRDFIGSWDFGYQPVPENLSLGQVVAASTAVPMAFPPVYLPTAGMGLRSAPPVLSLVDGGVYDNLGLEWFHGWGSGRPDSARPADFLVVVDASGPLVADHRRFGTVRSVNRSRDIQYFQTRSTRIRWLVDSLMSKELDGLYVVSKSDPCSFRDDRNNPIPAELYAAALPRGFAAKLAGLRTDLDRFYPHESALLLYHGYWSAHARLATFFPHLAVAGQPQWQEYNNLSEQSAAELLTALIAGSKRRAHFMRGQDLSTLR